MPNNHSEKKIEELIEKSLFFFHKLADESKFLVSLITSSNSDKNYLLIEEKSLNRDRLIKIIGEIQSSILSMIEARKDGPKQNSFNQSIRRWQIKSQYFLEIVDKFDAEIVRNLEHDKRKVLKELKDHQKNKEVIHKYESD